MRMTPISLRLTKIIAFQPQADSAHCLLAIVDDEINAIKKFKYHLNAHFVSKASPLGEPYLCICGKG